MPAVAQLHWLPIDEPRNGTEHRIRKTAERLTDFGDVYTIHPRDEAATLDPGVQAIPLDNPLLARKRSRIDLWYGALCLGPANPYHRLLTRWTIRAVRGLDTSFDLVVSEGPQMTAAAFELARAHDARVLLNKHNAMYRLVEDLLAERPIPTLLERRAVDALYRLEQSAIDRADAAVFQSAVDRAAYSLPDDTDIATIPNGTDLSAIRDGGDPAHVRCRYSLPANRTFAIYVGSYEYQPNREAADLIASELAPALPEVEFLLVGRNPPDAGEHPNVHPLGYVEDLAGVLHLADIAICPLLRGRGTKLKVMDYLAAGRPVVTTSLGVDGIDVQDGTGVLIRDEMGPFRAAIHRLARDEQLRRELGGVAANVAERYDWSRVLADYTPVVESLLEDAGDSAD